MSLDRTELQQWLDHLMESHRFQDYCPNGLQLEGRKTIRHIITGVTASQALIDLAVERDADCLLVHHGWFWKGEDRSEERRVGKEGRRRRGPEQCEERAHATG